MNRRLSVLFMVLILVGCASSFHKEIGYVQPVRWYIGFDLFSYIRGGYPPRVLRDISEQLEGKWEDSVSVEGLNGSNKREVGSCREFFLAQKDGLQPRTNVISRPYGHMGLMCIAAQIIVSGKVSKSTHIGNLKIGPDIANELPAEIAFGVPPSNHMSLDRRWSDVDRITFGVEHDKEVELHSEGATHYVSKIASGDFDGDGLEDILLDVIHGVNDGTYSTENLYVVTRYKEHQPLVVIKKFSVYK